MNWSDENYVRVYTRDTADMATWCWQANALIWPLMRKLDRSGLLELGRKGVRGLAALVRLPLEVVEAGLNGTEEGDGLLQDGCLVLRGDTLVMPNFLEAQEAAQSDRQRKKAERERRRANSLGDVADTHVTKRDSESRNVTESHEPSRGVTNGHSELSLAEPSLAEEESADVSAARATAKTEPGELKLALDHDRPPGKRTDRILAKWSAMARPLWELQERMRAEVIPGSRPLVANDARLKRVCELFEAGYTPEDMEHVLRVYADDAKRDREVAKWFNGDTNWRKENFERTLGRPAPRGVVVQVDDLFARRAKEREAKLVEVNRMRAEVGLEPVSRV